MVICDELEIYEDERRKILNGEESGLEKTMKTIRDSCSMSWLVLSPSALQDYQVGSTGSNLLRDQLEALVTRTGYSLVKLKKIMRNSSRISSAADLKF